MKRELSHQPKRQNGVALITAILVVTLVTILAVGMVSRQQFSIRQTANLLHAEQARLYHMAVEDHATPLLKEYWKQIEFLTIEEYEQFSALSGMGYQEVIEGGELLADIGFAGQGRFNLNNLVKGGKVDTVQKEIFLRLLQQLDISSGVADLLVDWIDSDSDISGLDGAEDGLYLSESPPYRTSNRAMVDLSELRLITGLEQEGLESLKNHVVVLPSGSKTNLNWASAEMNRTDGAFKSVEQLLEQESLTNIDSPNFQQALKKLEPLLTVSGDYFDLKTTIKVGRISRRYHTLLKRTADERAEVMMRVQEPL